MPTATIPATYRLSVHAQGGRKAELEAPSNTTIGNLRATVLAALQIQSDPNVQWFLHYQGEQLNDDAATLADVIGPHDQDKQVVVHLKKQPFAGAGAQAPALVSEPTATYITEAVSELQERAEEFAIMAIEQDGLDVYVTLMARDLGQGRERYTVRLRCINYNLQPPMVTLVDPITKAETASAWPNVPSGPGAVFRLNPSDVHAAFICVPGTAEWYSHGHSEFRGPEYWTLANIIEAIHFSLNSTGYQGRYQP